MRFHLKYAFLLFCLSSTSLISQEWTAEKLVSYESFDDFEKHLHFENDTTYFVNFWATWCGPCVKELPYIEELNELYKNEKFKVVLVSLDFKRHIDTKLIPFLNKKKIVSDVILLLDSKPNNWIDKVDPEWSGAIPISIVYDKSKSEFYEREFHSTEELINIIDNFKK